MSTDWESWEGLLGDEPITNPYVAGIPGSIKQGDTPTWNDRPFVDVNGAEYDSSTYSLVYTIAGPVASPLVLNATVNGNAWQTTVTSEQSAALVAGKYWWQACISKSGFRLQIAEGELCVELDLGSAGANYDGRTNAEKALAAAEAALATFQASGGRVQAYSIDSRHMTFQSDRDILAVVQYWRNRVNSERSIARKGRDRHIYTRFDRVN